MNTQTGKRRILTYYNRFHLHVIRRDAITIHQNTLYTAKLEIDAHPHHVSQCAPSIHSSSLVDAGVAHQTLYILNEHVTTYKMMTWMYHDRTSRYPSLPCPTKQDRRQHAWPSTTPTSCTSMCFQSPNITQLSTLQRTHQRLSHIPPTDNGRI